MNETPVDKPRGRGATRPRELPLRGWWDVSMRVFGGIGADSVSLISGGVAFYAFLSLFPAITALVSIYGLIADPAAIEQQAAQLEGTIPPAAMEIIQGQLRSIASADSQALGIGLAVSLAITLYSASKGMGGLITALNVVYGEQETRGLIKLYALNILWTLGGIVLLILLLVGVVGLSAIVGQLGLPSWLQVIIRVVRWALLLGLVGAALSVLYGLAPDRARAKWRWITPGAVVATLLWIAGSIGFSFYVTNFGSYNKTYGSTAAIVILMMWFWLTAFVILLGGEINSELERQTEVDSTTGPEEPMGQREAFAADTLGPTQAKTDDQASEESRETSDEAGATGETVARGDESLGRDLAEGDRRGEPTPPAS